MVPPRTTPPKNIPEEMGRVVRGLMSLPEDHEWQFMKGRGLKPQDAPDYQESEDDSDQDNPT